MSEYYCTKCGAVLNEQPGFDPGNQCWVCTECGQMLYGDDIYDGDLYPGTIWLCDSCGALLNAQDGFNDYCWYWTCTECGHSNPINADEIYESEEDYQRHTKEYQCPNCYTTLNDQYDFDPDEDTHVCSMCYRKLVRDGDEYILAEADYECPHCGTTLNNQYGFTSDEDTYTCSSCDTKLVRDRDKYIEAYVCPYCDSVLNNQLGFFDYLEEHTCFSCDKELIKVDGKYQIKYTCPKCGSVLNNQFSFIESYSYECDECGANLHQESDEYVLDDDYSSGDDSDSTASFHEENESNSSQQQSSTYSSKQTSDYSQKKAKESSKTSKNHKTTEKTSSKANAQPKKKFPWLIILLIIIGIFLLTPLGHSDQTQNEPTVVKEVKKVVVPLSMSSCIGENYPKIVNVLTNAGFTNIEVKPQKDLILGINNKPGEVCKISFDGEEGFSKNAEYPIEADIDIVYYALALDSDENEWLRKIDPKKILIPSNSRDYKGKIYTDVFDELKEAGFKDIKLEPLNDLKNNILKKDLTVDSVFIFNSDSFEMGKECDINSEVVIQYHSLQNSNEDPTVYHDTDKSKVEEESSLDKDAPNTNDSNIKEKTSDFIDATMEKATTVWDDITSFVSNSIK